MWRPKGYQPTTFRAKPDLSAESSPPPLDRNAALSLCKHVTTQLRARNVGTEQLFWFMDQRRTGATRCSPLCSPLIVITQHIALRHCDGRSRPLALSQTCSRLSPPCHRDADSLCVTRFSLPSLPTSDAQLLCLRSRQSPRVCSWATLLPHKTCANGRPSITDLQTVDG